MGLRRRQLISVYVTPEIGTALRQLATLHHGSVSNYVCSLIARELDAEKSTAENKDVLVSTQRYLTVGVDAILDHLDAKLRPAVRKVHATRFGGLSDAQ